MSIAYVSSASATSGSLTVETLSVNLSPVAGNYIYLLG